MSDAPTKPIRFRFPAGRRLKLSRDFTRVRTEGRSVRGALLTIGVLRVTDATHFRVGLITSKRVGGAVVRNRVRRRLREIVRRNQHAVGSGIWLVIIARPAAASATFAALEGEWLRLLKGAGIFSDSCS
jgi:ribonuclease P protein component